MSQDLWSEGPTRGLWELMDVPQVKDSPSDVCLSRRLLQTQVPPQETLPLPAN